MQRNRRTRIICELTYRQGYITTSLVPPFNPHYARRQPQAPSLAHGWRKGSGLYAAIPLRLLLLDILPHASSTTENVITSKSRLSQPGVGKIIASEGLRCPCRWEHWARYPFYGTYAGLTTTR